MLKSIKRSVWSFIMLALLPVGLAAQRYVYTNNDLAGQNYVSGYVVLADGTVGPLPGSPFSTGQGQRGSGGGFYAANRIIIVNNFLYASNSGTNTVSAFSISGTGTLIPVSGSPFATEGFNDPLQSGISLAATPDGKYLFAGTTGYDSQGNQGSITVFSIDPTTGALTATNKSPVAAGGAMSSMKVTPDGKYLLAAIPGSNGIAVFAIHGPGNLHQVHNSPYALSGGAATSVDVNCASSMVYAGATNGDIYALNFSSGGLSPVAGSPYNTKKASNRVVALSKNDRTLFSSNQSNGTVTAFPLDANGGLTLSGTSYGTSINAAGTTGVSTYPEGLAVTDDGSFLFAADVNGPVSQKSGLSVFGLAGTPPFTLDSFNSVDLSSIPTLSTAATTGLQSVAAYPAKACTGMASPAHSPGP